MLAEAAAQVAPVVSEARTLDRFIAPAQERLWSLARNLWWSWDNDSTSLFRDLDPVRLRELNHNPISLLSEMPLADIERRAGELMLHGRINYAYRRQQEYLQSRPHLGRHACRRSAASARRLFFGRIRHSRIHADLFRRPGRARRRSHQERFRSRYSARSASDLFYGQGYFRQRLDQADGSRKTICQPISTSCPWNRPSARMASR